MKAALLALTLLLAVGCDEDKVYLDPAPVADETRDDECPDDERPDGQEDSL